MKRAHFANFDRLERRLRLSGVLTTRTALRIGSGGAGDLDAVDLPVLRDKDGFPLIPGASLKGALRSTIEALVRGAGVSAVWACDPLADDPDNGEAKGCGVHAPGARHAVDLDAHCTVCRLLGSRMVASHVRLSDAMAIASREARQSRRAPVEVRDGVAIDRDLRVAHRGSTGGKKYDFEVVSPGTCFELELFVENPEPSLMGLLIVGLDQIADGFTAIGGFTSRGLGRVEIDWTEMTEVTAKDLLEGKPAVSTVGPALAARFKQWREALAERVREVA